MQWEPPVFREGRGYIVLANAAIVPSIAVLNECVLNLNPLKRALP